MQWLEDNRDCGNWEDLYTDDELESISKLMYRLFCSNGRKGVLGSYSPMFADEMELSSDIIATHLLEGKHITEAMLLCGEKVIEEVRKEKKKTEKSGKGTVIYVNI